MVGGVLGGPSSHGVCFGALSWLVEAGNAGEVDLSGLGVALVLCYDDDEPGSPWSFVLHVDERADERQREALEGIFLGRYGGESILRLPWVRKPSELIAVRSSPIEIRPGPSVYELRVGPAVSMRASRRVETDQEVACVIPGYERPGTELYADELVVRDELFEWELAGNCAFVSRFDYASD